MDGDKPEFVILSFDKYKDAEAGEISISRVAAEGEGPDEDTTTIDKLNQEILALKEEIRQKETAELVESTAENEQIPETIDLD